MTRAETTSYPVSIFIAGDVRAAEMICRAYCNEVGLCVTVTPTNYIYTGGSQSGVIVGLINYPRFPSEPRAIWHKADELAKRLCAGLFQESYTIQAPDKTVYFETRPRALRDSDTHRMAETGTGSGRSLSSAGRQASPEKPNENT